MKRKKLPGLTIQQVADRMGVHNSTVWAWINGGRLPATRHGGGKRRGGLTRIDPRDLKRFERPKRGRPRRNAVRVAS